MKKNIEKKSTQVFSFQNIDLPLMKTIVMEQIEYPIRGEYISMKDASNIQRLASKIFTNFDGGFGGVNYEDLYEMHQPVNDNITIGFLTDKPDSSDLSMYTWPPNDLSIDDYRPYKKSIRFSLFEVLFEICQVLDVKFSPTKSCINDCILKFNKQNDNE